MIRHKEGVTILCEQSVARIRNARKATAIEPSGQLSAVAVLSRGGYRAGSVRYIVYIHYFEYF